MSVSDDLSDRLELRACDPARNLRRRYVIAISRDLFGVYLVETSWGRIGGEGRSKREAFDDAAAAASAVRRIGVPYVPISKPTPAWANPEGLQTL